MSAVSPEFSIGQSVLHIELGEGVVTGIAADGYITVFFGATIGMRRVQSQFLRTAQSVENEIVAHILPGTPEALQRLWLICEATQLPFLETAAALTAAKVDLLPHQVVLTHRIAEASPRRFLIADEVGLGKTIETALVLRELASRGQLQRTLMIVPAGLVENWRHELNDVFHLDFEVFGADGDVTDRKTNAFAKHDRMIASIDTLKRPARIERILASPRYDLVVFDEAHHLTATRTGRKVNKTENFKLAEAIRDHTRDLLLLSATPHQGDHFRFWMLVRLLDPTLFHDEQDMQQNRHRLNAVVIRRTKADACTSSGAPLFARRQVITDGFTMSQDEQQFYEALRAYIADGYNLAESQGNAGRALGFVMAVFQKLAASSFAAVRLTLERRLLMLTIHESIICERSMDVDGRDRALRDARIMLSAMHGLNNSYMDQVKIDSLIADARLQVLNRLKKRVEYDRNDDVESEAQTSGEEDIASTLVTIALPEEQRRIRDVLAHFPPDVETKAKKLLTALYAIWQAQPNEKIVIFTTYLGSVEVYRNAIDGAFPKAGVEILKGGDHGAKTAAEKRFRNPHGPRVMICTAAGREGINLQFAKVLFNADLPWNPMDLEQRIGRIHRYGQKYTAQIYNLVAEDTIEGQIFLLLEQKVRDIAKTLGKVDAEGHIAEDLRAQILGQLSERISYEHLYQDGLRDPTLQRTRQELDIALQNARDARHVVLELFQDLDSFRLEDYEEVDDHGHSMRRLIDFITLAAQMQNNEFRYIDADHYLYHVSGNDVYFTTNRELAVGNDNLELIGLEHPFIANLLTLFSQQGPIGRALAVLSPNPEIPTGVLSAWHVRIQGHGGNRFEQVLWLGVSHDGARSKHIEALASHVPELRPATATLDSTERTKLLNEKIPTILQRALAHRGLLSNEATYGTKLIGWIEVVAR